MGSIKDRKLGLLSKFSDQADFFLKLPEPDLAFNLTIKRFKSAQENYDEYRIWKKIVAKAYIELVEPYTDESYFSGNIYILRKFKLSKDNIGDYSGVNLSYQYGGRFDNNRQASSPGVPDNILLGNVLNGTLTYQDWWAYNYRIGAEGICEVMEARRKFNIDDTFGNVALKVGLNASGGTENVITVITASDGLYNGRNTGGFDPGTTTPINPVGGGYTRDFGAQNIMGFDLTPVQTVNTYVGVTQGNLVVLDSKTVPTMTSNKSLFIRLPDLPIESFNTGKGSVSKIIHHIPRFDNSGNETGGLFFKSVSYTHLTLPTIYSV